MFYSAMCACQIRRFSMLFYSRARQSTCKFAWHLAASSPPLVLRRMGGQIHRFSPSAILSHKWLVFCRNYCVEFSLFISAPFTRARITAILHFLLSQPSPKGTKKRWSFLEKSSDVFLFFSDIFRKTSDFFGYSSHVFESWLLFASMALCEGCFSLFFLVEKTPFPTTTCEGCESKKARIPGNAPACHVRARKNDFF